jgi:serine protein kinase
LRHRSLITNDDQKKRWRGHRHVKREYEEMVKNGVQRAISADEEAIHKLASNYIDNKAYTSKKVKTVTPDKTTSPMSVDAVDRRKDRHPRQPLTTSAARSRTPSARWRGGRSSSGTLTTDCAARWSSSLRGPEGLHQVKTLVSAVVDKETQEKIDIIKSRLIKYFGYNEVSATDVLNYVASIFARGDAKD